MIPLDLFDHQEGEQTPSQLTPITNTSTPSSSYDGGLSSPKIENEDFIIRRLSDYDGCDAFGRSDMDEESMALSSDNDESSQAPTNFNAFFFGLPSTGSSKKMKVTTPPKKRFGFGSPIIPKRIRQPCETHLLSTPSKGENTNDRFEENSRGTGNKKPWRATIWGLLSPRSSRKKKTRIDSPPPMATGTGIPSSLLRFGSPKARLERFLGASNDDDNHGQDASETGNKKRIRVPTATKRKTSATNKKGKQEPDDVDIFFSGGKLIKWKSKGVKESRSGRSRGGKKFKRDIALLTDLNIDLLQERLVALAADPQIVETLKAVIQKVEPTINPEPQHVAAEPEHDAALRIIENINAFITSLSKTCHAGGTRPKEDQARVDTVLLACVFGNNDITANKLRTTFSISKRLAAKIIKMRNDGLYSMERKTRFDSKEEIAATYVEAFCHDDFVARADTSGGTSGRTHRNFVKVKGRNGEESNHYRRTWPCKSYVDKFNLFKRSRHYQEMLAALSFLKKTHPVVAAAEKLLRSRLDEALDLKLTIRQLKDALDTRKVSYSKYEKWAELVQLLYNDMFDDDVLELDVEEIEEEDPISISTFIRLLCPCVCNPIVTSCVDTTFNQIDLYRKALADAIRYIKTIGDLFKACDCDNCLHFKNPQSDEKVLNDFMTASYYEFLEHTCCHRRAFPEFRNENDLKVPTLIPRECTAEDGCSECGVHKNLRDPFLCPVWKDCNIEIKVCYYANMLRAGNEKSGKERTQEEIVNGKMAFNEVARKLLELADTARVHLNDTSWSNRAIRNSNLLNTGQSRLAMNIDYGATLSLFPIFKKNCHEDAHCVDLVILLHYNPRWVEIKDKDGNVVVKHFLRDTLAVHCFADTLSKGKKTDAYMIRRALEEVLVVMYPILGNYLAEIDIVSDNCKNQNKSCSYFWWLSTLVEDISPRLRMAKAKSTGQDLRGLNPATVEGMNGVHTIEELNNYFNHELEDEWEAATAFSIRQQYSEPMQGKGGHDGDAAVIKRVVFNKEFIMQRSCNATGVFLTITERLGSKTGIRSMFPNMPDMERRGDKRLLKFSEGTITGRLNMLFLEDHVAVEKLRTEGYQHVHYIERKEAIPTTATVKGSEGFKEIFISPKYATQGPNRNMKSSDLACPCIPCRTEFNCDACINKQYRTVSHHVMQPKRSSTGSSVARLGKQNTSDPPQVADAIQHLREHLGKTQIKTFPTIKDLVALAEASNLVMLPKSATKRRWVKLLFEHFFGECLDLDAEEAGRSTTRTEEKDRANGEEDDDLLESYVECSYGMVGLENFGNTCYLNTLVQFLSSSHSILSALASSTLSTTEGMHNELGKSLTQLNVLSGPLCLSLREFKRLFDTHACFMGEGNKFTDGVQSDPVEFLEKLLEYDFLEGSREEMLSVKLCLPDGTMYNRFTLLANRSDEGMEAGIMEYLAENKLNVQYDKLGTVIIVIVNRAQLTNGTVDDRPLKFPSMWVPDNASRCYNLRATINKHGAFADSGHYTAFVQRAIENQSWMLCDDAKCQIVDRDDVFQFQSEQTVYALMYELANKDPLRLTNEIELIQRAQELRNTAVLSDSELCSTDLNAMPTEQLLLQLQARSQPIKSSNQRIAIDCMNTYLSTIEM